MAKPLIIKAGSETPDPVSGISYPIPKCLADLAPHCDIRVTEDEDEETLIDAEYTADLMATHKLVGVPYTDEMIEVAAEDFRVQVDPFGDTDGLLERYPGAQVRNFDGEPGISEMDALIAYMQMLGTLVDFSTFEAAESR